MLVLAIDTALGACAAAILDTADDRMLASESLPMTRGHAEALMPLLSRLMKTAGLAFRHLDRVAVTSGPGSFTGLRVGIAAARGLALAIGKPAVGISTLGAYAAPYIDADKTVAVVVAIDARHQHVYLHVFGPGGQSLASPRLAALDEAVRAASAASAKIVVGTAAPAIAERLVRVEASSLLVDASEAPDIAWVARMGAAVPDSAAPPKPDYLRAPDAQPQNAAQLPRR